MKLYCILIALMCHGVSSTAFALASATGTPQTTVYYDAFGREVRRGVQRYNGATLYTDKAYDSYGRLQKESLPFGSSSSASLWSCFAIHKCNSNNSMEQIVQVRQVHNFAEIPKGLLSHVEKMGVDNSSIINEYEGKYLNLIFKIDDQTFDFVGKKVGFNRSKIDFFQDERERFYRNSTPVGGTILYIFSTAQKAESGGYDAAIVYWSKFLLPVEQVIKILKSQR